MIKDGADFIDVGGESTQTSGARKSRAKQMKYLRIN